MGPTPAYKFKIGLITATIWNKDGFYSVDMSRSYKNAGGRLAQHQRLWPQRPPEPRQMRGTVRELDRQATCRQSLTGAPGVTPGPKTIAAPPTAT